MQHEQKHEQKQEQSMEDHIRTLFSGRNVLGTKRINFPTIEMELESIPRFLVRLFVKILIVTVD